MTSGLLCAHFNMMGPHRARFCSISITASKGSERVISKKELLINAIYYLIISNSIQLYLYSATSQQIVALMRFIL